MFFTTEQKEQRQLGLELLQEVFPLIYEGKLKEAENAAARARDIFEKIDDKRQVAASLNLLSIVYAEMGNDSMDVECLLDGLEICIDEEVYDVAAKIYNNIGSQFMKYKDFTRALYYFNHSIEYFEKACESKQTDEDASVYFLNILELNLAYVYSFTGDLEQARMYYERAKVLSTRPENEELRFIFSAFEGTILWRLGEQEKAKECSEATLKAAAETEYTPDYMEIMSYLIELLKDMKDYPNLKRAITILENHHVDDEGHFLQLDVLNYWAEYYKAIGDNEKYLETCIQYYELSRKKVAHNNQKSATEIEMKAEIRRTVRAKKKSDSIVFVDSLTQIGNRNKMLEDSKGYIEEAVKNTTPLAVGLIDIDFFKECNDTYGHVEGDNCLKIVAEIINNALGDRGNVYRYGGDEFLLLLPNASVDSINEIGRTIKETLADKKLVNLKSPINKYVTVSQGYTMAYPEAGDTIEWLINLSDKALYMVKRCGKNNYRYVRYDEIVN